tara:strand:- start:354 stop:974 length:621 start_codon:yes stop_codon:yes gene_type:complete
MIKEELNNIDNPLPNETFTAAQAIEAVNRLLWSENVEDDDFEDATVIKAFLVGTLPNIPVQPKMSKNTPVMETTIEGANKRIIDCIEWNEWLLEEVGKLDSTLSLSSLRTMANNLEYIGVFLDTVGDEMAAITSSCNSLHARYVEALAAIDEWKERLDQLQSDFNTVDEEAANHLVDKIELKKEIDILKATIASLERQLLAAHDNR